MFNVKTDLAHLNELAKEKLTAAFLAKLEVERQIEARKAKRDGVEGEAKTFVDLDDIR